jgi:hypothetical protein
MVLTSPLHWSGRVAHDQVYFLSKPWCLKLYFTYTNQTTFIFQYHGITKYYNIIVWKL